MGSAEKSRVGVGCKEIGKNGCIEPVEHERVEDIEENIHDGRIILDDTSSTSVKWQEVCALSYIRETPTWRFPTSIKPYIGFTYTGIPYMASSLLGQSPHPFRAPRVVPQSPEMNHTLAGFIDPWFGV